MWPLRIPLAPTKDDYSADNWQVIIGVIITSVVYLGILWIIMKCFPDAPEKTQRVAAGIITGIVDILILLFAVGLA